MIYFHDERICIRTMQETDPEIICTGEISQGWNATQEKYRLRLRDQADGKAISVVAEYFGNVAGYINVYFKASCGPFVNSGCCEIVDFGVLQKYRCHGIGTALMDTAEKLAAKQGNMVSLGVGLYSGYGNAQKLYVKRGYIPDGTGAWYKNEVAKPYEYYRNDDDFILYLYKKLC